MPFGYSGGGGTLLSSRAAPSPLDTPFLWNNYNVAHGLAPVIASPSSPASTAPGTIAGTPPTTYNPAVGGIPSVPDPLKAVQDAIAAYTSNFNALQELANKETAARSAMAQQQMEAAIKAAMAGQAGSLPAAQAIANQINAANQAAAVKQITDLYPQFTSNTAQLGANIADWAAGNLSQSTTNAIIRAMAERGVAGGFGADSPATNAALMSLIGKTSEALQQQGLTGQNTLISGLPKAPLTSAEGFMLSPNTILSGTLGQMGTPTTVASLGLNPANIFGNLYNAQLQAALYRAAPDPAAAYNLAKANLTEGLTAGGRAGAGPYAGTPTTGGTSSPEILKFLQDLINRTSGSTSQNAPSGPDYRSYPWLPGGPAGPSIPATTTTAAYDPTVSAYYNVNPYVPTTDNPYGVPGVGTEEEFFDWLNT